MEPVLALSVRQPWAELILRGQKTIELRSWKTGYRGPLWLHTGVAQDLDLEAKFDLLNLFYGGYIGSVMLSAIVPMDRQRWDIWKPKHLAFGPYQPGLYAWILSSPCYFARPVLGPGQLNLFRPDVEIQKVLLESANSTLAAI